MFFGIFTELCNNYHYLIAENFYYPAYIAIYPLATTSHLPFPLLENMNLYSDCMDLPVLDNSYQWNHTTFDLFCLKVIYYIFFSYNHFLKFHWLTLVSEIPLFLNQFLLKKTAPTFCPHVNTIILISIFAITNLHIFGRQFPLFLLMVSLLNHFLFAQMYFTLDLDTSSPIEGFPHISVGKESACNTGDPSSIPGSGRSAGEEISLSTPVFLGFPGGPTAKKSACNAKTWVKSLGWEDPLETGKAIHSNILSGQFHGLCISWGCK